MRDIKAAIFDVDGLLLDTEGIFDQVIQRYAVEMTGHKMSDDVFKKMRIGMYGIKKQAAAELLHDALQLGSKVLPEHYLDWRQNILPPLLMEADLMPGAEQLVKRLHNEGVPMAVATSSTREDYDVKTARHQGVFVLFDDHVVTGDQVSQGKPNPEIFLKAAELLGVDPTDAVAFEDAESGVSAAKQAGMYVVAVPHPWLPISRVAQADVILKSLEDYLDEVSVGLN